MNSYKYKLVIFDMDGTILNTLEDLADSVNHALKVMHLPTRTLDEVRTFVGNGIRKLIERSVPEGTSLSMIDKTHREFLFYYEQHRADKTRPYDHIPELLQKLKDQGILLAVASNKADKVVKELCEDFFPGIFHVAIGDQPGMQRKPAPDAVHLALEKLRVDAEEAIYVGDSEVDIETARNAGIPCISVDWGFKDRAWLEDHGAQEIVSDPLEIPEHL